jgi:glycosyltransferase involved in cell wall biosynthesis
MRLLVDARWIGMHGIGRFAREILSRLPEAAAMPRGLGPAHPADPAWAALHLARLRPDVYFSPGFNPPLAAPVPFVITLHDLIPLQVAEERRFAKRLYYERLVRPATRRAFRVITVSESSRREIADWAGLDPERIVVAGNGVSPGFAAGGDRFRLDRPYVLYVGSRSPHKNVRALLHAFAASGLATRTALLLSGAADERTRRWIAEAGLGDAQVRFAGAIPESCLPDYYRGALALAIPSLAEGFGLPALEAMACGTPVLAAARGALPEVLGEAGHLVDPTRVEAIAAGLQRVVSDEPLRARLAERGPERAARFRWEDCAARVQRILEAAAAARR